MAINWYVARDGKRVGPLSLEQLKQFAASGKLRPADMVWQEGTQRWVEAGSVGQLFPEASKPVEAQPVGLPADASAVSAPDNGSGKYWILKGGAAAGPYTAGQIRTWLEEKIVPADLLACMDGGKEWVPLPQLLQVDRTAITASPATEHVPPAQSAGQQTVLEGIWPITGWALVGAALGVVGGLFGSWMWFICFVLLLQDEFFFAYVGVLIAIGIPWKVGGFFGKVLAAKSPRWKERVSFTNAALAGGAFASVLASLTNHGKLLSGMDGGHPLLVVCWGPVAGAALGTLYGGLLPQSTLWRLLGAHGERPWCGPGVCLLGAFAWYQCFGELVGEYVASTERFPAAVNSVAYSRGMALAGTEDGMIRQWPPDMGVKQSGKFPAGATKESLTRLLQKDSAPVLGVAFSPGGLLPVSASADGLIVIWHKEPVRIKGHASGATCVCFSPDGRRIASGCRGRTSRLGDAKTPYARLGTVLDELQDRAVRVSDAETGAEIRRLAGHTAAVNSVAFLPDGRKLLSGSSDRTIRLWDVETGREWRRYQGHTGAVSCIAVSADGTQFVSASDDVEFQDGKPIYGTDNTVRLWDVQSGTELKRFVGHRAGVNCVVLSPDGRRAASGSDDGTIRLWDLHSGREVWQFARHRGPVTSLAFSADGRRLLSGSTDKTVRLWGVPR